MTRLSPTDLAALQARLQWWLYHIWHAVVHVGLRHYRYFCHYCAERDGPAAEVKP